MTPPPPVFFCLFFYCFLCVLLTTSGSFDSITCAFGILHLAAPHLFFSEAHRLLSPSGRLSFSVWQVPTARSAFALVTEAIKEHGDASVSLPGGDAVLPFFHFASADACGESLAKAGFARDTLRSGQFLTHMFWFISRTRSCFPDT